LSTEFNFPKEKIITRWVPTVVITHTLNGSYGIVIETSQPRKKIKHEEL
jgi:hypothetical protein